MVAKGFNTLQTISPVFCTAQEKYLSKKNTAVVILGSVCSPSSVGAVGGKKNRWKIRFNQSPLKSQISNGISIWCHSSSAILGCGKDFFIKQLPEPFLADLMKSLSPLILRYCSYWAKSSFPDSGIFVSLPTIVFRQTESECMDTSDTPLRWASLHFPVSAQTRKEELGKHSQN